MLIYLVNCAYFNCIMLVDYINKKDDEGVLKLEII
jgi:hypothetical protein